MICLHQFSYLARKFKAMSSKWLPKKNRKAIETRDQMTCCYCGITCVKYNDRINDTDYATLDHIVPQAEIFEATKDQGLEAFRKAIQDIHNLVLVCNGCNSSKQDTPLYVWVAQKGYDYATILSEIARRISMN